MNPILENIINELKRQKITQKQLTDYLNISENCFGSWKRGANQSYLKYLHAISDFLGVSVEYLRGETDVKEKPLPENEERLKELYELTKDLSETEMVAFKAFLAGLKANRKPD